MVYIINSNGQPLMPTKRHGRVKHLLREGKAKVVKRCPFTIQLLYEHTSYTQPIVLGVDTGSKTIGVSAVTNRKEVYSAEIIVRNDIKALMDTRRSLRRSRRNRKTRYRKARFLNRVKSKHKGWLAPSIRQKIETHQAVIRKINMIMPITAIIVEVASFDIHKIKAMTLGLPIPQGVDYQQGELYQSQNVRQYVFFRDGYTCQWCHGKSKNKILHTHHWAYWKGDHSDKPSSQITLCDVCNDSKHHKKEANELWGWEPRITFTATDAVFMGIMRWNLYQSLKEEYQPKGVEVSLTYGYITKAKRIEAQLPKKHHIDARCITGQSDALPCNEWYFSKKIRCHNRQLHKANPKKGVRKRNQAPYEVKGFRLFDKVEYHGQVGFITGRRSTGYFAIKTMDGTAINNSAKAKDLKLLEKRKYYVTERRSQGN